MVSMHVQYLRKFIMCLCWDEGGGERIEHSRVATFAFEGEFVHPTREIAPPSTGKHLVPMFPKDVTVGRPCCTPLPLSAIHSVRHAVGGCS